MRLRTKIVVPITLFTLVLLFLFGLVFIYLINVRLTIGRQTATTQDLVNLSQRLSYLQNETEKNLVIFKDSRKETYFQFLLEDYREIPQLITIIEQKIQNDAQRNIFEEYKQNWSEVQRIEQPLVDAINNDQKELADQLLDKWLNLTPKVSASITDFSNHVLDTLTRSEAILDVVIRRLLFLNITVFFFSLLMIFILVLYLRQIITRPIHLLARAAHRISEGQFKETAINFSSGDELGDLAKSLRHMKTKLAASYRFLEQEVRIKTKELAMRSKLEKQKDDFIAMASHELRTPITSQKAYIQLLERQIQENDHDQYQQLIKKIELQTTKMTKLIADLLDVSKINIGKLEINPQPVNLNELISNVTEDINETCPKQELIIKGQVSSLVEADNYRIQQVVSNLIRNAIKYSPNSRQIIINLTETDDHVKVSVQDFGVGIEKKYQKKIFERFFRIHTQDYQTYTGMGIGLNLSAEIIKLHQGKIWVESKHNQGANFFFTLPIKQSQTLHE